MWARLKQTNWLIVAGVLTAAYAGGLIWLLGWARIATFLSIGNELNAIGDFLAGVFAPVALIWLVAAVFTQRQELNETREQFEENQKVVDAQLKTINSQNALLALQHNQAQESAKQTYKLNLFERRFNIYNALVAVHGRLLDGHDITHAMLDDVQRLADESAFLFSFDIEQYLTTVALSIRKFLEYQVSNSVEGDYGEMVIPETQEYSEVHKSLDRRKATIEDMLSVPSLRQLMWSSIRVSDV